MRKKKTVIVGMSGGVDSSVSAHLLQQQGYDVTGVFMQNWDAERDDPFCTAEQDLTDARIVCDKLNIPFKTVNFTNEYWENVFRDFLNEYALSRTPNPDILCNREIKFKAFLDHAFTLGADYIATGHYVRSQQNQDHISLLKGKDADKDQSYFLYMLGQKQLQHSLFPLGEHTKNTVRQIAKDLGLVNHAKKDSTGICFIGERKFKTFLNEYLLAQPGKIETVNGDHIGNHDGLMFYTLGQRQGLKIGGIKKYPESPWYVLEKDIDRNVLIVGQDQDHPLLMKRTLTCQQLHWIAYEPILPLNCTAKIRYRQLDQACFVSKASEDSYHVDFEQAQRAITPGQSVVFYHGEVCLGGGIIKN